MPSPLGAASPASWSRRRVGCLRVGCAGWNYASWRGRFYPADLPQTKWLEFYAQQFDTVELNNSFYRLPARSTFGAWGARVPERFLFAVKASAFLTHRKRLREPREPVDRLFGRSSALGARHGPVLYQLPPQMHLDLERLDGLLEVLPTEHRHVLEFRHTSWYVDAVYERLSRHGVALCLHDRAGSAISAPAIGPFVYVRFHGAAGNYHGSYTDAALDEWADRLAGVLRAGQDVFAYFNNDPEAVAPADAARLRTAIEGRVEPGLAAG